MVSSSDTCLLQLFSAAADVLRKIGVDGRVVMEFIQLGAKAKAAACEAMDTEEALGEIPKEFLDPIQVSLSFLTKEGSSLLLLILSVVTFPKKC